MAQRVIEVRINVEVDGNEMSAQLLQRLVENTVLVKAGGEALAALRPIATVLDATLRVTPAGGQAEIGPECEVNLTRRPNA